MADPKGRIEELAAKNLEPAAPDPCAIWDGMVAAKMQQDGLPRSGAVVRLLSTHEGSNAWMRCCGWDAARPKILPDGTKSGNWLNQGSGFARRVPRQP